MEGWGKGRVLDTYTHLVLLLGEFSVSPLLWAAYLPVFCVSCWARGGIPGKNFTAARQGGEYVCYNLCVCPV